MKDEDTNIMSAVDYGRLTEEETKMKLKTLKELDKEFMSHFYDWDFETHIRKEAIKWVKGDRERFGLTIQGEFWQRRFNITEEDLKSEDKRR